MRAAEPLAGAPPFWMDVSTVYVLPLGQQNLRGNYVRMPTFALPAANFPSIQVRLRPPYSADGAASHADEARGACTCLIAGVAHAQHA